MALKTDGSNPATTVHTQIRTTFLVPNLHCASCVSNIENALFVLRPRPSSVSPSIVSQLITVHHDPLLLESTISKALEEAGFEIYSVIQDAAASTGPTDDLPNERNRDEGDGWLEKAMEGWLLNRGPVKKEDEKKRDRHVGYCDMCRAEEGRRADAKEPSSSASTRIEESRQEKEDWRDGGAKTVEDVAGADVPGDSPFVIVGSTSSSKLMEATVSIAGMTCGTCVGKISEALEAKPWLRSVDVSPLTNSAFVTFEGEEHLRDVANAIEDVGYEATLEQFDEVNIRQESVSLSTSDTWRATYAIGGMTCSACIGHITEALNKHTWLKKVDVNLISNSATVVFEGKSHLVEIVEAIEDIGYEATLDDVVEMDQTQHEKLRRTVAIRVDGMYCGHCPSRIHDTLREFDQRVNIRKPLSTADPILQVTYIPHSPDFTIRHILAFISATDPALETSIYHPPTLEERSQMIHAREQRRILLRAALSVTVAIPTLIIGVVLTSLVSSDNAGRQFLMRSMWSGGVSRAEWALFIMATPVYFFAADVFHRRALKEVRAMWRRGSTTPILQRFYRFGSMNMLMSLGTSIAYFSSVAQLAMAASLPSYMTPTNGNSSYFDSVVFLTMFLLIGRLIEAYSKSKTGDAVTMLGKLRPTEAILVDHDGGDNQSPSPYSGQQTRHVNVDLLEFGDIVRVLHGASPPCDGTVIEGESKFDESSLTGESRLVGKSVGDEVFSGTVNKDAPISVRISGVSGASMLDQIVKAVREGQTRRAPIERVADVLTGYFVPFVTVIAVSTWILWLSLGFSGALPADYLDVGVGGWSLWSLQFAIAVFVVACPCGIALAAPTALFVGGGLAAQHGILVKGGGEAFQEASGLDCIVFDKTGTLTQGGEPVITNHEFVSHEDEKMALAMIQMLEESSSHPVAKAVVSFCKSRETRGVTARRMEEIAGKGMRGSFATEMMEGLDVDVIIGNEALMADYDVQISNEIIKTLDTWKTQGRSIALVAMRIVPHDAAPIETQPTKSATWNLSVIFAASDPLRPEASAIIEALQHRGIDVWMISGDNSTTACAVGDMVGIAKQNIIAGVLPGQKAEKIQYLQKSLKKSRSRNVFGRSYEHTQKRATVAMVGDGINDSPALTMADVGIAIGSGSDIAISSAEFVLVSSSLTSLLTLIDLSRTVFNRIKFNFGWALIYNLIALPVAAGVLYPVKSNGGHVRLDPVWASLAMALSSVSVVCSSLLLRSGLRGVGFRPKEGVQGN